MKKIGETAKLLGVSIKTVRRWTKIGYLKCQRTPGNTRLYKIEDINEIIKPGQLIIWDENVNY